VCVCVFQAGKQAGVHFDVFIPKIYQYQIVAGKNYLVKVNECLVLFHRNTFSKMCGKTVADSVS